MAQYNKLQFVVQDGSGNAIPNASIDIRNQGATVAGTQAGPSYTVDDTGSVTTASQVQGNTLAAPVRSVTAVTLTVITTAGAGLGTINDDGRIVVVTPAVSLYNDVQGNESKTNPLTTDASGKAYCWVALNKVDVIFSATGYATTIEYDRVASGTEYNVSNVFDATNGSAIAFKHGTSATLGIAGALLASWNNPIGATPPKVSFGYDGTITSRGNLSILGTSILTGAVTASAAVSVAGLLTASNSFTYSGAAGSLILTAGSIETADLANNCSMITYIGDGTADQAITAAAYNTANYVDITGATVTYTPFSTSSEIVIVAQSPSIGAGAAAYIFYTSIRDGAGTILSEQGSTQGAAAADPLSMTLVHRIAGLSGSQTFKVSVQCVVANSAVNNSTNAATKRITRIVVMEFKK